MRRLPRVSCIRVLYVLWCAVEFACLVSSIIFAIQIRFVSLLIGCSIHWSYAGSLVLLFFYCLSRFNLSLAPASHNCSIPYDRRRASASTCLGFLLLMAIYSPGPGGSWLSSHAVVVRAGWCLLHGRFHGGWGLYHSMHCSFLGYIIDLSLFLSDLVSLFWWKEILLLERIMPKSSANLATSLPMFRTSIA